MPLVPSYKQQPTLSSQQRQVFTIKRFQALPEVDFGTISYTDGCAAEQVLDFSNPEFTDMTLSVSKFPQRVGCSVCWTDDEDGEVTIDGSSYKGTEMFVEGNESVRVTFKWEPTAAGNIREMLTFTDGKHNFQMKLVGEAKTTEKPKGFTATALPTTNEIGHVFKAKPKAMAKFTVGHKAGSPRKFGAAISSSPKFLKRRSTALKLVKRDPAAAIAADPVGGVVTVSASVAAAGIC